MTARLSELEVHEVSLVDKAANKKRFLVVKSEDETEKQGVDLMSKDKEAVKKEQQEVLKADGTPNLDVRPETARAAFETIWKAQQEAKAEAEGYKQKLEKELTEKETQKFLTKAAEFSNLSIAKEDLAEILKASSKNLSKEHYAQLEKTLKSANESSKEIFKEAGTGHPEAKASSGAHEELETKAKAIAKAEGIDYLAAYTKAMAANPAIVDEVRKEAGQTV